MLSSGLGLLIWNIGAAEFKHQKPYLDHKPEESSVLALIHFQQEES